MSEETDMANSLTNAVREILASTSSKPSRVTATYEWAESDISEALVPSITIQWFNDEGCVQK